MDRGFLLCRFEDRRHETVIRQPPGGRHCEGETAGDLQNLVEKWTNGKCRNHEEGVFISAVAGNDFRTHQLAVTRNMLSDQPSLF